MMPVEIEYQVVHRTTEDEVSSRRDFTEFHSVYRLRSRSRTIWHPYVTIRCNPAIGRLPKWNVTLSRCRKPTVPTWALPFLNKKAPLSRAGPLI